MNKVTITILIDGSIIAKDSNGVSIGETLVKNLITNWEQLNDTKALAHYSTTREVGKVFRDNKVYENTGINILEYTKLSIEDKSLLQSTYSEIIFPGNYADIYNRHMYKFAVEENKILEDIEIKLLTTYKKIAEKNHGTVSFMPVSIYKDPHTFLTDECVLPTFTREDIGIVPGSVAVKFYKLLDILIIMDIIDEYGFDKYDTDIIVECEGGINAGANAEILYSLLKHFSRKRTVSFKN